MVGCLIAGSRCTYRNGVSHPGESPCLLTVATNSVQATAVIPGSHLWDSDRVPKVEECTYAEMEPGSALFTLGCTYVKISTWRIADMK